MFDLTSSKLLILGIVALVVVPPKDLPALLRAIGKYMGMLRRQADEFRAQFDAAIKEAELDTLKTEMTGLGREMEGSVRASMHGIDRGMRSSITAASTALDPQAHWPLATEAGPIEARPVAGAPAEAGPLAPVEAVGQLGAAPAPSPGPAPGPAAHPVERP